MNNWIRIDARRFHVFVRNNLTGEESADTITLSKQQLQAAQTVGQSSKELIQRIYARHGFKVLAIGKADKLEGEVNLQTLFESRE